MTDESTSNGPSADSPDEQAPLAEIDALLRQVPPDDEAQLAAFALLRAYRREALCSIATCVDPTSKKQAVVRARERLKRRLISLLAGSAPAAGDTSG